MEHKALKAALSSHIIGDLADVVLSYSDREVRVQGQWGREGSGEGEFKYPTSVCYLNGEIVVVDSWNHRIQVLSSEGKFLRQWGRKGSGEGEFNHPCQVTLLSSGEGKKEEIMVTDAWNHRIQVFTPEGKFLRQWGAKGMGEENLDYPRGISPLSGGRVMVSGLDSIQIFTTEGKFLSRWSNSSKECQLSHIVGITALPNGRVAVADDCGRRIQIFTEEGEFLELVEKVPAFSGSQIQVFALDNCYLWQRGDHDTIGWWIYSPTEFAYLSDHRVAIPNHRTHQIQICGVHLV